MNFPRVMVAIVLFSSFAGVAGLGADAPAQIWSAADFKHISAELAPAAEAKGLEGKTLAAFGTGSAALWRRTKSGEAELHKTKTDLLIIEEGEATLVFGGVIPGVRVSAPNELRGASITAGESRKLTPGDVIRIPAGTPHQFILTRGQSVAYFALKIAR